MRRLPLLVVLLAPLFSAPVCGDEDTTEAEGAHFRVVVHFESETIARSTLAQVEALWDVAADLYGLPKGRRREKLAVHLYRDALDYQVAEEDLTGGRFRDNLAMAHFDSKSAHVALQPDLSDEALAALGLPYLTRSLLLHEAAHLIRFEAMPTFRSHPDWFGDGLAMWLKHRVLAPEVPDAVPLSSTLAVKAQRLLEKGTLPTVEAILADDLSQVSFYDRYAVCCLFVRHLIETDVQEVRTFIRKARRFGGGSGLAKKMADAITKAMAKKQKAGLDESFRAWVRGLEPRWEEVIRSLSGTETERIVAAFPSSNAVAWRTKPVGRTAYALSASVEIMPNSKHQMNVLLDRTDESFLVVALSAGYGVTLFEYERKGSQWHRRASAKCPAIAVGKPFRVEVKVEKGGVAVVIEDQQIVRVEFPKRELTGPCGLGALAGSAGVFRDLKLP